MITYRIEIVTNANTVRLKAICYSLSEMNLVVSKMVERYAQEDNTATIQVKIEITGK